jgi:CHAT domain-containing protein
MFTSIVLNEDTSQINSTLRVWEIFNLNLSTDLTVLNCCYSGGGKASGSGGMISLGAAFQVAGSRSVIMNYWNSPDESGTIILSGCTEQILNGKDLSEALRDEKMNYIKTHDPAKSHPYYWAGYVLLGKSTVLKSGQSRDAELYIGIALLSVLLIHLLFRKKLF